MKKTILGAIFALSTLAFSGPAAYADNHCACDQGCTEKCEKGDHKSCGCKTCDCGKGKACKHGKCSHDAKATKKSAKTEAAPAATDAAKPASH